MVEFNIHNHEPIAARLRQQAEADAIRITVHCHQEMVEEDICFDEVREVLLNAAILENYPEHKRGPCCLSCGKTLRGRYVHVVCTTAFELTIIITVYEPKPPKWADPFTRGKPE